MKERIERLRKNRPIKTIRSSQRGYEKESDVAPYREGVKLCLERARFFTDAFRNTEGQPLAYRKAKALEKTLVEMTIYIDEGQLIVGNYASSPWALTCYPEMALAWINKAVKKQYMDLLDENGRKELEYIAEYWKGKSVQGKERNYLPNDLKEYWRYNGATMLWFGAESGVPDYEKLFRVGLNGIVVAAEEKLESISDLTMPTNEFIQAKEFLEASIICLKAAINFSRRFAVKADELSRIEADNDRKRELQEIAAICNWVLANPPRSFHEGLQCFWFIHLISHMIELYMNGCGARLDQILYPLYKNDVDKGNITRDAAVELLQCLFLKMDEHTQLMPPITASGTGSAHGWSTITIGGIDITGRDASNEISYLILEASKGLVLPQPSIAFRYHSAMAQELVLSAIDLAHTGIGYPAFFNDKEYEIPMLVGKGIPIEDARSYGIEACMRWTIPGKNMAYRAISAFLILPKCLELALNRGIDKFTQKQMGKSTSDPLGFKSMDDVVNAYLEQVDFFMEKIARINNFIDVFYKEELPRPFLSALMDGCIEKAKDCRQWSYFYKSIIGPMGTTTLADSLSAIKKVVFDDKLVTMSDLLDALNCNWEGKEKLRHIFQSAPHFGNDDDYVDNIALDVLRKTNNIVESYFNYQGFCYLLDGSSGSTFYGYTGLLGASADGRRDKDPINDGTISPVNGRDKQGPTAVLNSVKKVDPLTTFNHLLNQKFLPQILEGKSKTKFATYIRTWSDLGIHHIQFNVCDKDMLLAAQRDPEKHSDLVVRVAGYSAYFVDLPKGLQDQIIERTEHGLVA